MRFGDFFLNIGLQQTPESQREEEKGHTVLSLLAGGHNRRNIKALQVSF
jgi:hypothetical protein